MSWLRSTCEKLLSPQHNASPSAFGHHGRRPWLTLGSTKIQLTRGPGNRDALEKPRDVSTQRSQG